jgi:Na+-translocating ferredoxin:NAD+ oxidoreductase RnfE subunit
MLREFYQKNQTFFDRFEGLLMSNTVLEKGLVIAPVIVASTTLKNSLYLGIAFFIITTITVFFTSFLPRILPYAIKVTLHTILASALLIPTTLFIETFLEGTMFKVGIFLPLLVTNSLIVGKSRTRFHKKKRLEMLIDLISHGLGFFVVIILVGALREYIGSGTIFDFKTNIKFTIPAVLLPFSGFIIVGFMSAFIQRYRNHFKSAPRLKHRGKRK